MCLHTCERERKKEEDSANYVCVIGMQSFFPTLHLIKGCNHKASCCSTHITSLPPLLHHLSLIPHRTLPSVEETPAGGLEVLHPGESTAVASPFSAVAQHSVASCLKMSLCLKMQPCQGRRTQIRCGIISDGKQITYGCE